VLVLLANLSEHKPEYYPLFLFSLRAAFRPGEIRGACGSRTLPLTVPSPWRVTSRPSPGGALAPQERRRPLADRLGSHKDLRPFSEDLGASCRSCGLRWLPAAEGGRPWGVLRAGAVSSGRPAVAKTTVATSSIGHPCEPTCPCCPPTRPGIRSSACSAPPAWPWGHRAPPPAAV